MLRNRLKIFFICTLILYPNAYTSPRQELIDTIKIINSLKMTLQNEESKWLEEKKTLELQLALLQDETARGKKSSEELSQSINTVKKQSTELQSKLLTQEKVIEQIDQSCIQQIAVLQKSKKLFPASLQTLIQSESKSLNDISLNKDADVFDRLSAIRNYLQAAISLQKKIHKVKELVTINGKKQEVDAIYIGTQSGYYLNQASSECGLLIFKNNKWITQSRPELKEKLALAIKNLDREGSPVLVNLPVIGAQK